MVALGSDVFDCTVRRVLGMWCLRFFQYQRGIPEAVDVVTLSDDNCLSILVDFDVVFLEQGDIVIAAQLANGDK